MTPVPDRRADDDTVLVGPGAAPRSDDTVVGRAGTRGVPAGDDTVLVPRTPTSAAATTTSARPARRLHGVRAAGRDLRLDVPVVVGRRPSGPRVPGPEQPVLVRVHSATGEVSSTHVRVEQQGDTVVVTDLRSTNGTVVALPGRVPVRLRQGESAVALAGTIVDIGDGNLLEVLPPQRIPLQEDPSRD